MKTLADWIPRTPLTDGVTSIVFIIILYAIPVLLVTFAVRWAREDAEARGASKIVSVILVVLFFPLGWALWLIIRPKKKEFNFEAYKSQHSKNRSQSKD